MSCQKKAPVATAKPSASPSPIVAQDSEDVKVDENIEKESIGIDGKRIKAFLIAYQNFLKDSDLPKIKKDITNYNIGLRDAAEFYEISFLPIQEKGTPPTIGGATDKGTMMSYKINKTTYQIIKHTKYQ